MQASLYRCCVDWRRTMGRVGRALIASGILILLFVAYQLWGTGIAEARSQKALKRSFNSVLTAPSTSTTSTTTRSGPPVSTSSTLPEGPPPPPTGDALAIIRIPKLGVEKAVVQGVTLDALKKGPGHYPDTPIPGQPGNSAIAGHRTTYGAPFFELDKLKQGDQIFVTTAQGRFLYVVRESRVVKPNETTVLNKTDDNRLTLTTCHPRFSSAQRLIVISDLSGEAAPLSPPPVVETPTTPTTEGQVGAPDTQPTRVRDTAGLSGRRSPKGPAIGWGVLGALVWLIAWMVAKRWRRWPAYIIATPIFLVVLFQFFENFSRLLPANF